MTNKHINRYSKSLVFRELQTKNNSIPRNLPKRNEKLCSFKNLYTRDLFTITKNWKPPQGTKTGEWISKWFYIHTTEYYSAIRTTDISTSRRNLKCIRLSVRNQSQKAMYCMSSPTWEKKQAYRNRKHISGYSVLRVSGRGWLQMAEGKISGRWNCSILSVVVVIWLTWLNAFVKLRTVH